MSAQQQQESVILEEEFDPARTRRLGQRTQMVSMVSGRNQEWMTRHSERATGLKPPPLARNSPFLQ